MISLRDVYRQCALRITLPFPVLGYVRKQRRHWRRRAHLTAVAAGRIAREAVVSRIDPFHFSPRYSGQEARLLGDVMTAFAVQREKSH
jgi:ribonuclease BN (tRNA processing enzyme)